MIASAKITRTVTIELSEEEANWLKGQMQNYRSLGEEDHHDRKMRESLYGVLDGCLPKQGSIT